MSKQRRSQQQPPASTESLEAAWALSAATAPTHTATAIAGVTTAVHGWTWAIATLAQSLDSDRRCNVSIADSIVLASEVHHARTSSSSRKGASKSALWLTTHKSGAIVRKKLPYNVVDAGSSAFPAAEVSERFVQLASQWAALGGAPSPGTPPFVAVLVRRNGARQLLEPRAFQEWLDVLEASGSTSSVQRDGDDTIAGLQVYVPPARGSAPSFVTVMYTAASSSSAAVAAGHVDVVYRDAYCSSMDRGATLPSDAPPQASRLRKEAERAVLAIVDALQRGANARIQSASLEFVVDCEDKLWLTHVDRIEVTTQLDERSSNESTALGLRKQSLPTLSSAYASGIASGTSSDVASAKCRGEFCQTVPAHLPGLFFLSGHSSDDSAGDNNSSSGNTEHGDTQALPDTGQRFKIGNNNVQLARAERRFLLGTDDSSGNSAAKSADARIDRALRWQEVDAVLRTELGRSNPTQFYKQVPVCPNCYRIYSELNKLRDNGFRAPGDVTPRGMKQSRSASALSKPKALAKPTTTQQEIASASASEPSTDAYDQLFLAELAKHSDDALAARPELEDASSRPSSRSERPSLPSLTASTGTSATAAAQAVPRSKKAKPKALSSSSGPVPGPSLARPSISSNNSNQATGSALGPDDDTLRLVSTLRTRIAALEDALAASETQRQQLEHRVVQTQTQCTAMLSEKDAQMRTQRLELELELALSTKQSQQSHASEPSASATEMSKLIETIESLSAQIEALQVAKEREKKAQSQTHQSEIKRLHDKYQSEMEALRLSEHAAKEQVEAMQLTLVNAQNQAHVAATQARSAKAALEDLTATTLAALEEKNRRLERHVAELKATAQQQSSHHSSQASSALGVSTSAATSDLEALEKHMANKVAYLKAQLASEMKCKEELGQHLAQVTATIETLKRDKRQALADQDEAFKRQVARLESGFAHDKDVLVAQHAALQAKVVTLQANVTDLVQEVTLWQSKDANAKLALDKMVEENVRQTRQIVDLEAQVEALQDERQRHASASTSGGATAAAGAMSVKTASDETQRMQMEALLRRVDNERQYVKNQLENEQAMREKSQQHAAALQRTITELQQQLSDVSTASDAALRAAVADAQRVERAARDTVECLEESKRLLTRQLSDVQAKFATAREQALLDRDELEKMRIHVQDAQSQLAAARDELAQEKERSASASTRSAQALALVKRSLQAMETETARRVQRLEDEAAQYMRKLADTQAEMLVLQDKWVADRVAWTKQLALTRLALVVKATWSKYSVRQQHRAFSQFVLHTSTQQLCAALDQRHSTAMSALDEQLRREFMDKCDDMAQRLLDERMDAVRALTARFDADRTELQQCFDAEKTQLLADAEAAQRQRLQALEETHTAAYSALEARSVDARKQLDATCKTLERERDALAAALAASQQQCIQLETVAAVSQHAHDAATAQFASETRAREQAHAQALADATARAATQIAALECEHANKICIMVEEHAEILAARVQAAIDETQANAQAETEALHAAHAEDLATARAQHGAHVQDEVALVTAQWQRELESVRALGEQTLHDAVARAERKAQAQLETLERELSERKGHAIVQCTSKWQRALEELQTRLDVEKQVAYDSGVRDRESEWQLAATQIKQQQKDELARVQHEALRAIQAAEERHAMQFTAQLAQRSRELEAAHANDLAHIEHDITVREQLAADQRVAEQVALAEQALETEHARDVETREREWQHTQEQALAAAFAAYESEKQALLAHSATTLEQQLADTVAQWTRKLEALSREKDTQTQQALDAMRDELASDYDHDTQALRESLERELAAKLEALETRLLREQDDAVAQVQDDSERLIEQVEQAMTELKTQKDAMERELAMLRHALEAAEDAQFDATEQLATQRKRAALDVLALVAQATRRIANDRVQHAQAVASLQQTLDSVERTRTSEQAQWRDGCAQVQATWRDVTTKHDEMRATLTTYKRDELVAHRSASSVLANELAIVTTQMTEVREMKAALERDVEALQTEAQSVEASVRQLMAQSTESGASGSGGASLNMAVVAKKRRLNEEFEALLEQIERKRAEVRSIDATLSALQSRRESKELEMKAMERKLVEILVQQQKRMLTLLTAVRELPVPAPLTAQLSQQQDQPQLL